jgi:hypothetical protein
MDPDLHRSVSGKPQSFTGGCDKSDKLFGVQDNSVRRFSEPTNSCRVHFADGRVRYSWFLPLLCAKQLLRVGQSGTWYGMQANSSPGAAWSVLRDESRPTRSRVVIRFRAHSANCHLWEGNPALRKVGLNHSIPNAANRMPQPDKTGHSNRRRDLNHLAFAPPNIYLCADQLLYPVFSRALHSSFIIMQCHAALAKDIVRNSSHRSCHSAPRISYHPEHPEPESCIASNSYGKMKYILVREAMSKSRLSFKEISRKVAKRLNLDCWLHRCGLCVVAGLFLKPVVMTQVMEK